MAFIWALVLIYLQPTYAVEAQNLFRKGFEQKLNRLDFPGSSCNNSLLLYTSELVRMTSLYGLLFSNINHKNLTLNQKNITPQALFQSTIKAILMKPFQTYRTLNTAYIPPRNLFQRTIQAPKP